MPWSLQVDWPALSWPICIALAWVAGALGHRWTGLPRIGFYGLVGFAMSQFQWGVLPPAGSGPYGLLANVAFGLILFEFGYRINLRWLTSNPLIGITGLLETALTFIACFGVAWSMGMSMLSALLLSSLAASTSPATVMRVINEERSSGQVTERLLHLTAINCLISVFAFKVIVGVWTFQVSGDLLHATWNSAVVLAVSAGLGAAFGVGVPALLRWIGSPGNDATVAFGIGIVALVATTHAFKMSPVLACLTFGLVARHRRIVLNQAQRNFGALGDLVCIVLFVYVATTIDWSRAWAGLAIAAMVIVVRTVMKVLVVTLLAPASGTTLRKGALTGLAMTPISVFVILLLEQARFVGIDLIDQVAPLAAVTLILELIGPAIAQRALMMAGETVDPAER